MNQTPTGEKGGFDKSNPYKKKKFEIDKLIGIYLENRWMKKLFFQEKELCCL